MSEQETLIKCSVCGEYREEVGITPTDKWVCVDCEEY